MKRSIKNALLLTFLLSSITQAAAIVKSVDDFNRQIQPLLETYCYDCHGQNEPQGKVKLTELLSWKDLEKNPQLIEKMI